VVNETTTLFRWHRGTLEESLATVVEVADRPALDAVLKDGWYETGVVIVKPYGFDARIGWDAHIVTVNGVAVGFTNGPL